jgi:tetratricopeptide (TPR) repeat protein
MVSPTSPRIDGRFEIVRLAGEGGMGRVYEARDGLTGTTVAVKVLHAESASASGRFAREIRLVSELRHRGVVRYVAHGVTDEGRPYLAMEWLSGETLHARLARGGLGVADTVALGLGVARALGAVHRAGVVHRDLKPSNVFLVEGHASRPVLIDFGVAHSPGGGHPITLGGAMVGTPGYMAPEQVRGDRRIDARADLFALGCVLFKCLTGQDAFTGEGSVSVMFKVVLEEAARTASLRSEVPRSLDDLVARMMAKERTARLPDAEAVVAVLEAIQARGFGGRASAAPPGLPGMEPIRLTGNERRLTCLVMVREAASPRRDRSHDERLAEAVERHKGRLTRLADGTLAVMLGGAGAPTDLAARAARCALAVRDTLDGAPISLAAGLCEVAARLPVGDLIDRAVKLLEASAGEGGVRLDEVMASLLGERFDVRREGATTTLHGEVAELDTGRRLLGRPTICLGRERELGLLEALFRHVAESSAAVAAVVLGEPGVGKSRLRHELLRRLRERGHRFEVWIGAGDPMSAGSAFAVLARAVRHAVGIVDGDAAEVRREKIRRRASALGAPERSAAFLGELAGAPFPDAGPPLRAARADPVLMGDQMRAAAEDLLREACARTPLVLVLEDLQWGDLPTVTFVDAALRNLEDLPLLVLAVGRPEVDDLFPRLWEERSTQVVRVPPLPRRAAERLVRHALGDAVPDELVRVVVERSGGNAFYLEELTRSVASGEGVVPVGTSLIDLPETVLAMVHARLESIDPELRRVLRAASVFGRSFSVGGVEALLGAPAGRLLVELVSNELLVRQGDGVREPGSIPPPSSAPADVEYGFRHAMVRDAAYGMLTADDRALGHRLAGAYLERQGKGDAMALAEHFERGDEPGRAAAFYRRAAEEALTGNDLAAALGRADRGAACGAAGEELGALRAVQAEAHVWRGELGLAEERAVEAMALLVLGSPRWFRVVAQAVSAASKLGAIDRALSRVDVARAAIPGADATIAQVLCFATSASELVLAGRYAAADGLLAHLDTAAEPGSIDPRALGMVAEVRGFRAAAMGDLGAARESLEAAVAAHDAIGDRRLGCTARGNLGFALVELGGHAEAETALRAALAEAEHLGLTEVVAVVTQNLGYTLLHVGRAEEARALVERAVAALRRQRSVRQECAARAYLARIHLALGDAAAAEREARAAADPQLAAAPLRAAALAVLSLSLSARGRAAEALSTAEEAFALLEAAGGSLEEGEALVRRVHAQALAAAGRHAEAQAALAVAKDRLLARAAAISDPMWRERFLTRVPDNAATLAGEDQRSE